MKLITPFDPSDPAGQLVGIIDTLGVNVGQQLMLYNASVYGMKLTFQDGNTDVMPPNWNKDFIVPKMPMGKVKWQIYNQMIGTGYPMSSCYGTLYNPGEHVASVNASLGLGTAITGGAVLTSGTNAIVNDGNATGTQFIEVTILGAPGSSFIFKSDGTITMAELIANVVTPFIQSFPGQAIILKLGEVAKTVEILGNLTVDGVFNVTGGLVDARGNPILNYTGTNVHVIQPGNAAILFDVNGVADVAHVDSTGLWATAINFTNGRIREITTGGPVLAGVINHGMSSTPLAVIATVNDSPSTATVGCDTYTASTFTLRTGAAVHCNWIAIR